MRFGSAFLRAGCAAAVMASVGCGTPPLVCAAGTVPTGGVCRGGDAGADGLADAPGGDHDQADVASDSVRPDGSPADASRDGDATAGDACVPATTPDLPDPDWTDTNCDGIDGDASHAVFVAPAPVADGGVGGGTGTRADPFHRVSDAIGLARTSGAAVLIASGEYSEAVTLADGIHLAGGYDPATWRAGTGNSRFVSPCPVLRGDHLTMPTIVLHVDFVGQNGTTPGASCVAGILDQVTGLAMTDLQITAGSGAPGVEGVAGADGSPGVAGSRGLGGGQSAAAATVVAYGGGSGAGGSSDGCTSVGGRGGSGGTASLSGTTVTLANGSAGQLSGAGGVGGLGGLGGVLAANTAGRPGGFGAPGYDGIDSPTLGGPSAMSGFGAVTRDGYMNPAANGSAGSVGNPGEGGGGGGGGGASDYNDPPSYFSGGSGGGGGGSGGCGGLGGGGGTGGGASIALAILGGGTTTLTRVVLTADNGGAGGSGGRGGLGAVGGPGGAGGHCWFTFATRTYACTVSGGIGDRAVESFGGSGGAGGWGSRGGGGGAGAGGPSIGLLTVGTTPVLVSCSQFAGQRGAGGLPGDRTGMHGAPGLRSARWDVP